MKELVVDNSTNNSSSDINKISVFGKGKYCFHGPKDRQVKHYPNKKALTLSIGSAKKNFWGFKEISSLSFKYMEFVLTTNHFCNWYCSSNYWGFFNRKKSSCLERSYCLTVLQFHFLKPLDIFMRLLKYANKVRLRKR